jgi:hypothetical protein
VDEFQDLLNRLGTDNPPSMDELREAKSAARAAILEATTPDTLNLELARELRQFVDSINTELTEREAAEAQAREEAAELRAGLEDDEGTELQNGGDGEGSGDGDGEGSGDGDGEGSGDGEGAGVTASGVHSLSEGALRAMSASKRRAARDTDDVPAPPAVRVSVAGPALGARTPQTLRDVSNIFHNHAHRTSRGKQPLVSMSFEYPTDRRLSNGATENTRLLEDALSPRALTASGGICEPLPADFSHPICGDRGRPIRAALPRFAAGQGGVRYAPSATLADLAGLDTTGPVTIWSHDTDTDPGTTVKPCPHVECEPEVEVFVDAVVACLEVGNFQARFNPEFWRSQLDLLMVLHDRIAEQTLYDTMTALSTAVTIADLGNTAQTFFVALDRAIAGLRSRHRLLSTRLRWIGPSWMRDAIRASIAYNSGDDPASALSMADATINSFFTDRNVDPTWSPDVDVFGTQGAGAVITWPNDIATGLLFPEGTFFFLDGGTLDLGTEIRDSTLNSTNDRQAFLETFENVAFRGCEAYSVSVPIDESCVCLGAAGT